MLAGWFRGSDAPSVIGASDRTSKSTAAKTVNAPETLFRKLAIERRCRALKAPASTSGDEQLPKYAADQRRSEGLISRRRIVHRGPYHSVMAR